MQITITANSLKELREVMDALAVLEETIKEDPAAGEDKTKKIIWEKVDQMVRQGCTNREIAEILGVSYSSICLIAKELRSQ